MEGRKILILNLNGIEQLTVFPDYLVPLKLGSMGFIKIDGSGKIDSEKEVKQRIATIIAFERIIKVLNERSVRICPAELDSVLWEGGKEIAESLEDSNPYFYRTTSY